MKFFSKWKQTAWVLMVLMAAGCSMPGSVGSSSAKNGSGTASPFTLQDSQGGAVSLEDALKKNKAVLLNFWATWCPPCREEIPDLIRLQNEYGKSGFTVLGINVGESAAKVSGFVNKMGINYPVLLDSEQSVATQYGIVGIPTSYLVSSDGKILGEYHAATAELFSEVKKALGAQ